MGKREAIFAYLGFLLADAVVVIVMHSLLLCGVQFIERTPYIALILIFIIFVFIFVFVWSSGQLRALLDLGYAKTLRLLCLSIGVLGLAAFCLIYVAVHPLNYRLAGDTPLSTAAALAGYNALSAVFFPLLLHQLPFGVIVPDRRQLRMVFIPFAAWIAATLTASILLYSIPLHAVSPPAWITLFYTFLSEWRVWWLWVWIYGSTLTTLSVWVWRATIQETGLRNALLAAATLLFFLLLILPFYAYPLTALTAASIATIALTTAIAIKYSRTTNLAK